MNKMVTGYPVAQEPERFRASEIEGPCCIRNECSNAL